MDTMFWKAKNSCVIIGDDDMNYISFGMGKDILIILPGLGDGLTTVKGMAIPMAIAYRKFAKDYKVYVFSRRNNLKKGYSTRDMASDQAKAMEALDIKKAKIWGVSQGGMIAQYLAIDYPNLVEKLILTVTSSKPNEQMQNVVGNWISMAKKNDYKHLMIDTAEKSYSEKYLKKYRWFYSFLGVVGKPKNFDRFIIQAISCIQHNAYAEINNIVCPVLIIGGDDDRIIGVTPSIELANRIKDSELYIYKGLGHAVYEEAKDFNSRVYNFF